MYRKEKLYVKLCKGLQEGKDGTSSPCGKDDEYLLEIAKKEKMLQMAFEKDNLQLTRWLYPRQHQIKGDYLGIGYYYTMYYQQSTKVAAWAEKECFEVIEAIKEKEDFLEACESGLFGKQKQQTYVFKTKPRWLRGPEEWYTKIAIDGFEIAYQKLIELPSYQISKREKYYKVIKRIIAKINDIFSGDVDLLHGPGYDMLTRYAVDLGDLEKVKCILNLSPDAYQVNIDKSQHAYSCDYLPWQYDIVAYALWKGEKQITSYLESLNLDLDYSQITLPCSIDDCIQNKNAKLLRYALNISPNEDRRLYAKIVMICQYDDEEIDEIFWLEDNKQKIWSSRDNYKKVRDIILNHASDKVVKLFWKKYPSHNPIYDHAIWEKACRRKNSKILQFFSEEYPELELPENREWVLEPVLEFATSPCCQWICDRYHPKITEHQLDDLLKNPNIATKLEWLVNYIPDYDWREFIGKKFIHKMYKEERVPTNKFELPLLAYLQVAHDSDIYQKKFLHSIYRNHILVKHVSKHSIIRGYPIVFLTLKKEGSYIGVAYHTKIKGFLESKDGTYQCYPNDHPKIAKLLQKTKIIRKKRAR